MGVSAVYKLLNSMCAQFIHFTPLIRSSSSYEATALIELCNHLDSTRPPPSLHCLLPTLALLSPCLTLFIELSLDRRPPLPRRGFRAERRSALMGWRVRQNIPHICIFECMFLPFWWTSNSGLIMALASRDQQSRQPTSRHYSMLWVIPTGRSGIKRRIDPLFGPWAMKVPCATLSH